MGDSDDDDYVYFGSPLEELAQDEPVPRKAPRIEDQIVTDKQGRRRFHGAFTGGFSAGYYNSVGTKEGWAPSTFVSSKGQRADAKRARPQDFMDDEDLGTFGISPQGVAASVDYDAQREQRKRKRGMDPQGPIPGTPVLEDILRPASDTMGMKLLRRLGWRPGQGIGPRVTRRAKRVARKQEKRMYGCQGPGGTSDGESDDEEADGTRTGEGTGAPSDVTFAPDDVHALLMPNPKQDTFGLGYSGLDRRSVLGGSMSLFDPSPLDYKEKKKRLLIKGQAFGVGAFEEEDEDIYATEDMSNYDFNEEEDDKTHKKPHIGRHEDKRSLYGMPQPLKGFILTSKQTSIKKYPWPSLPKNFMAFHKPNRRRFERKESELRGLGRHDLTPEQRARLTRDTSATVEVRSGVKQSEASKIIQSTEKKSMESSNKKSMDTSEVDKLFSEFKSSEKCVGSNFKPFAKQPDKQKRYELYLRMKEKGQKDRFYLAQPREMTEWERQREAREFSRAAQLFQPLTSTMATRFVTAAGNDSAPLLKDGLNTDIPKPAPSDQSSLTGPQIDDDRIKAAKMMMYGQLTQISEDWYPDRVLCRRFNLPNPYPESNFVGVRRSKKEKLTLFSMMEAETAGLREASEASEASKSSRGRKEERSESEENSDENEEEYEDKPETYGLKVAIDGPPTMDLFKAIFQDSDSEEEENEEKSQENEEKSRENQEKSQENQGKYGKNREKYKENQEKSRENQEKSSEKSNSKNSIDNFLIGIRRNEGDKNSNEGDKNSKEGDKNTDKMSNIDGGKNIKEGKRKRVSRFEPMRQDSNPEPLIENASQDSTDAVKMGTVSAVTIDELSKQDIFRPVFIPKKKTSEAKPQTSTENDEKNTLFPCVAEDQHPIFIPKKKTNEAKPQTSTENNEKNTRDNEKHEEIFRPVFIPKKKTSEAKPQTENVTPDSEKIALFPCVSEESQGNFKPQFIPMKKTSEAKPQQMSAENASKIAGISEESQGNFKPQFIPAKKKETLATKATPATGIFANIDLASFSNFNKEEEKEEGEGEEEEEEEEEEEVYLIGPKMSKIVTDSTKKFPDSTKNVRKNPDSTLDSSDSSLDSSDSRPDFRKNPNTAKIVPDSTQTFLDSTKNVRKKPDSTLNSPDSRPDFRKHPNSTLDSPDSSGDSSSSSLDDAYGPDIPDYLKNRGQTIRDYPGPSRETILRLGEKYGSKEEKKKKKKKKKEKKKKKKRKRERRERD